MYEKITALYCRYSRDDGQEEENASITHQRELLKSMPKITAIPICVTTLTTVTAEQILTVPTFSVCLRIFKTV